MSKMHNLGTVIKFEITRSLKKKSFWISALAFPVITLVIFGVIFLSNKATGDAVQNMKEQNMSIALQDDSKLIDQHVLGHCDNKDSCSIKQLPKDEGIAEVKAGKLDAYFYFPADLTKQPIETYGKDVGIFENNKYSEVAKTMLKSSISSKIPADQLLIAEGKMAINSVNYKDGKEYNGFKEMIAPGVFLILFYLMICIFGGQILSSTVEEKENRTVEMLLTTVEAKTLIVGKMISIVSLALIQFFVMIVPILIMYFALQSNMHLPTIDFSDIPFNFERIAVSAMIFFFGFFMFTGILTAIGAVMPTAKEAQQWFGVVMMFMFVPLYGSIAFVSIPESPFVKFFSTFPLTSPMPLLLRSAVGNLSLLEALISIAVLIISSILITMAAVKLFRYGAMMYDNRLPLSVLFKRKATKGAK